ncbi:membrane protein of unknown function [Petrocella atlantisensis]|uniref:Uncharacterized protein n=1 Tax=Petrocella atlantisensis TaxID=2173034 RepID=A0A3P7RV70_9FIRM|nr:hypothetical protein [Petrocella atlantisensis]VDN46686.1 membrane protein of unknown function [Petrocella atlantisensis]
MELLKAVSEYGAVGGVIALLSLAIKLNLAELIFNTEFDKLFWSKSKRSISRLVTMLISFAGVLFIVLILSIVSVALLSWMIMLFSIVYGLFILA